MGLLTYAPFGSTYRRSGGGDDDDDVFLVRFDFNVNRPLSGVEWGGSPNVVPKPMVFFDRYGEERRWEGEEGAGRVTTWQTSLKAVALLLHASSATVGNYSNIF